MLVLWNSTVDCARRQLDGSGVPVGLNKRPRATQVAGLRRCVVRGRRGPAPPLGACARLPP
jgi:hypothetical protein